MRETLLIGITIAPDFQPWWALLTLDVGAILIGIAIFWYAQVLRKLIELLDKPDYLWELVALGGVLMVVFAVPHILASFVFYPNLSAPLVGARYWYMLYLFRAISVLGMFFSGLLALIPSALYWFWSRE